MNSYGKKYRAGFPDVVVQVVYIVFALSLVSCITVCMEMISLRGFKFTGSQEHEMSNQTLFRPIYDTFRHFKTQRPAQSVEDLSSPGVANIAGAPE